MDNKTGLVIRLIPLLFVFTLVVSCVNCEELEEGMRNDECQLIVEKKPQFGDALFNFRGKHPKTGKACDCNSGISYKWWNLYNKQIDLGDTLIKNKGELTFNIHKKDTVLTFHWECNGKIYK